MTLTYLLIGLGVLVAVGAVWWWRRRQRREVKAQGEVDFSGALRPEKIPAKDLDPSDLQTPADKIDYLCQKYQATHEIVPRADSKIVMLNMTGPENMGSRVAGRGDDVPEAVEDLLEKLGEDL